MRAAALLRARARSLAGVRWVCVVPPIPQLRLSLSASHTDCVQYMCCALSSIHDVAELGIELHVYEDQSTVFNWVTSRIANSYLSIWMPDERATVGEQQAMTRSSERLISK